MRERKKVRLKGYDYAASGAYFITTCVKGGFRCLVRYKTAGCGIHNTERLFMINDCGCMDDMNI
jgi:hypothetical protein